jgi:hypothetical protein
MSHRSQPKKRSVKVVLLDDEVGTSRQRGKKGTGLDAMDTIKEDNLDDT